MKLWKKILIVVAILGVVAFGLLGYGAYKTVNGIAEWLEPRVNEYVMLNAEEQNKFLLDNFDDVVKDFLMDSASEATKWEKMKDDPEFKNALVQWGRTLFASVIVESEELSTKISPEQLAKYKTEAASEHEASEKIKAVMNKYETGK